MHDPDMMRYVRGMAWLLMVAVFGFPSPSRCADVAPSAATVHPGIGLMNVFDSGDAFWRGSVEWRLGAFGSLGLAPAIGIVAAEDDSLYLYAELRRDFILLERWALTPSFGAGWFNNEGIDLGHDLEFRSGIEVTRFLAGGRRIGLALYHLSNSSLSEVNPGTETLVLSVGFPL